LCHRKSSYEITPLKDVTVTDEGVQYCGEVSVFVGSESTTVNFYPILVEKDWEDEHTGLSAGEKAAMYVVATLFAALIPLCLISLAYTIHHLNTLLLLFSILLAMCIMRCVYFYLVATGVLGDGKSNADFVLFELPSFFFMSANIAVTAMFAAVFLARKSGENIWKSWALHAIFIVGNLILYVTFAIIIILFNVLDDSTKSECGGRDQDSTPEVTNESARTIRIVYKSLLLGFAALIALALVILGTRVNMFLGRAMKHLSEQNKSTQRRRQRINIAIRVWILCFGLITSSIAFIVYYVINKPHPLFVLVLIPTEVIPISVLVAIELSNVFNIISSESSKHSSRGASSRKTKKHLKLQFVYTQIKKLK